VAGRESAGGAGTGGDPRKKSRLGKGLGALLGEYLPEESSGGEGYRQVAVNAIVANPFQPRREFVAEQLAELESSIRQNGLLQPLVVRPAGAAAPGGAEWELVAGERRLRAVRQLGWKEVPVVVREMDDRTLLVLAIVENVQRADLSPLEEAEGYRQLIEEFGYTQKEVAESVGRERSTIANLLRLLHLPASVQRLVTAGRLSMGHARAILGVGDQRRMADLARRAADEGLSVRTVEDLVRSVRGASKKRERPGKQSPADPHIRKLETELQRHLGTEVRIRVSGSSSGKVEIPFYSVDDFERVTEILLGAAATER
jgi:ParB family transcriptional regulator, chromosome partitioning protein